MTSYSKQLAQRKQEATDEDAALVAHFGPKAENCANWDGLWQRGWREELVNPSPTDTYEPKGLPPGWVGGWVSADGRQAGADPPSLYSDKFIFYFTRQLADDKTKLIARATNYLVDADEIDCDQLTNVVDTITICLNSKKLHYLAGNGHLREVGHVNTVQIEEFFQNWDSKKNGTGLFITSLGIAIANHRVIPAEVVRGKLQAVRRQIESRQSQSSVCFQIPKEQEGNTTASDLAAYLSPKCSVDFCDKAAKLIGLTPGQGADTFTDLRIHALAAALKETHSLSGTKGVIGAVRLALAHRYAIENYNVKYDPQHGKGNNLSGRNDQWDTFFNLANRHLSVGVQQKLSK